jgi:hypothetical protein
MDSSATNLWRRRRKHFFLNQRIVDNRELVALQINAGLHNETGSSYLSRVHIVTRILRHLDMAVLS